MARVDPYWGVLTHPEGKHGAWSRADFLASGEEQIERSLAVARSVALPQRWDAALDFGCGLGRLTRALSTRFATAHGVDVSESLIEQARALNRDAEHCDFRVLGAEGLSAFDGESIDLVCSLLVLQHQDRRSTVAAYIAEFIRVLRPGGVVVFQMPTHIPLRHRIQPRRRAYGVLRSLGASPSFLYNRLGLDPLRMQHMTREQVLELVSRAGGTVVAVRDDTLAGEYPSATYYVGRGAGATAAELPSIRPPESSA
jgi:SAM-dependent methyltransferase